MGRRTRACVGEADGHEERIYGGDVEGVDERRGAFCSGDLRVWMGEGVGACTARDLCALGEAACGAGDLEEDLNASRRPLCPSRRYAPHPWWRGLLHPTHPPGRTNWGTPPDPRPAGGYGRDEGARSWS